MARSIVGRETTRGGVKGHYEHVDAYTKFVPAKYDTGKKKRK